MTAEVFFLGNCQGSRMAQFYGAFTPAAQKKSMLFRSITPHFGEYHEDEGIKLLEDASIAIVQLINTDYVFNRENVLAIRGDKPTIFIPYVYLPGFRSLEKLSSKGVPRVDGEELVRAEMDRVGHAGRGAVNFVKGLVDGQNKARIRSSLSEMKRREAMGSDVHIADFIADSFRDRMPCFSINHPAPYILFEMYNQVAKLAGFPSIDEEKVSPYDLGRATLPAGTGGLTPYCVEALGLTYEHETHWFSATNKLAQEIGRRWTAEQTK